MIVPPKKTIPGAISRCIVAPKGTGKSVLIAHLLQKEHKNEYRWELAKRNNEIWQNGGFKSLELADTLCYCENTVKLKNQDGTYTTTNFINPYELQIPTDVDESIFLQPYSFVVVDEAYRFWGNRDAMSLPERVESLLFLQRQLLFDLLMIFQEKTGVDKKFRENLTDYCWLKNLKIKYYSFKADKDGYRSIKKVKWEYWQYFDFESFEEGIEPLKWYKKLILNWRLYNPTMWFPFNMFNRRLKYEIRQECETILNEGRRVKLCYETAKYDPFKLYDTHFYEFVKFNKPDKKSLADYEAWAKELRYKVEKGVVYDRNVKDAFAFNQRINSIKPESFTKARRARALKEKAVKKKSLKK